MKGPPVPVTGVGPVCPHLLSPLWTPLGLASLRTELFVFAVEKPSILPSVQSARAFWMLQFCPFKANNR